MAATRTAAISGLWRHRSRRISGDAESYECVSALYHSDTHARGRGRSMLRRTVGDRRTRPSSGSLAARPGRKLRSRRPPPLELRGGRIGRRRRRVVIHRPRTLYQCRIMHTPEPADRLRRHSGGAPIVSGAHDGIHIGRQLGPQLTLSRYHEGDVERFYQWTAAHQLGSPGRRRRSKSRGRDRYGRATGF